MMNQLKIVVCSLKSEKRIPSDEYTGDLNSQVVSTLGSLDSPVVNTPGSFTSPVMKTLESRLLNVL
jgi:hypothetical protein